MLKIPPFETGDKKMFVNLYKSYSLCVPNVGQLANNEVNCNGNNWEVDDFIIDGDTALWNNHTWLFSKIEYGKRQKCLRLVAKSNRTVTKLNYKTLLGPV